MANSSVDHFLAMLVTALLCVVTIPSRKLAILSWGKQNHVLQSQTAGVLAQRDKSNVDQLLDMPVIALQCVVKTLLKRLVIPCLPGKLSHVH